MIGRRPRHRPARLHVPIPGDTPPRQEVPSRCPERAAHTPPPSQQQGRTLAPSRPTSSTRRGEPQLVPLLPDPPGSGSDPRAQAAPETPGGRTGADTRCGLEVSPREEARPELQTVDSSPAQCQSPVILGTPLTLPPVTLGTPLIPPPPPVTLGAPLKGEEAVR
ncbi:hypothetical protein NDU88_000837 [Pleurodeles waltl]|uniref:Uncharacterized protein n=1 Tax=Pleurodeles waltl TaxID=8319 RepID=A0AAV7LB09_PLEWA|nr:hypothetical protein NDU88_000837 [Pleurodeles waltl]